MGKVSGAISFRDLKPADMMKWLRSVDRKTLIQWSIIGGALFAFIFFFFLPMLNDNNRLMAENQSLQMMMQEASVKIARIPELKEQKSVYGARIAKIRDQFFEVHEKGELIKMISTVAAESGVRISASKPSAKKIELPDPFGMQYEPVNYELNVEGSYHDLGEFINGLELHAKNFSIFELQIAKKEREGQEVLDAGVLESTSVLTAFVKKPPGTPQVPGMIPGMEQGAIPGQYPPPQQ